MKKLLLAAGHSNTDPGAVNVSGLKEAEYVLAFRDLLYNQMNEIVDAKEFLLLRDGKQGENLSLSDSIKLAKSVDIAIEFHLNAAVNTKATGIEVIAQDTPSKKKKAQDIASKLSELNGLKLRGNKGFIAPQSSARKRLGFCEAGGFIVELGFISNQGDMIALNQLMQKIKEGDKRFAFFLKELVYGEN